jgi:hypothetical protein
MIIVAEGDETEGLKGAASGRLDRDKHFSHASDGAGLSLKSDLDKISLTQRFGQAQEPAGHGDRLKFGFGALTIFQHD